ncbi:MAG: 50S ribosomal protein L11 methyltransferase [Candidatus Gastranaerophilales bacterium]|nr:50S ribosomal protein L11 methyltransferase [Candidatus Gastranaerophilales bacterium]
MSVIDKTYWEVYIEINPICADVVCDIVQSEFECEGIITAEEKYKNLELVSSTDNIIKAYISADVLDFDKVKSFFKKKRQDLIDKKVFIGDIGTWNVTVKKQEIVDWSQKWKEHWKPSKISNRIVICPTWEKYETKDNEIKVYIDPGNAFGTGTHATTQLCVKACEKYMKNGAAAADIGCGSGILAICAMKLGAKLVNAVDTDETAVETAKINAAVNNELSISFKTASSEVLQDNKYDFVFANILHNILADIMPDLKRIMKKGAKIVLSGILEGKEEVVLKAIEKNNLKIIEEMKQKEWTAFVVQKED